MKQWELFISAGHSIFLILLNKYRKLMGKTVKTDILPTIQEMGWIDSQHRKLRTPL